MKQETRIRLDKLEEYSPGSTPTRLRMAGHHLLEYRALVGDDSNSSKNKSLDGPEMENRDTGSSSVFLHIQTTAPFLTASHWLMARWTFPRGHYRFRPLTPLSEHTNMQTIRTSEFGIPFGFRNLPLRPFDPTLVSTSTRLSLYPSAMKGSSPLSRRSFLATTAKVATATLAAPTIIPASVLGRAGLIPPSERVTMGFIGIGGQGGGHLLGGAWTYVAGGYAGRKDVQVLAVCDVWRERRERACQQVNDKYAETLGRGKYRACEAYVDFRDVLERNDIDAVLIATPAHWHATMAIMAAEAGKDIYCEKPTAVTIDESKAMLKAIRRYGRVYQAGTQQRSEYGAKFRQACEFVRSGRIGKLREIYAYRDGGGLFWPARFGPAQAVPPNLDWDLYLGPAPWLPFDGNTGAHRFDIGELNWGQHHYDIVQWAAAADETGPVDIFLESNGRSGYKYASGVVVYGKPYPGEPIGGEGGACFVGTEGRIAVDRNALVSDPAHLVREPLRPEETHLYRSASHSGNFLECVRTRKKTICDADIAHRAASALLLGGVAKQLGRGLKWDPVTECFPGDAEGNRLLAIAKRSPWNV